jgi:hypothetical protein
MTKKFTFLIGAILSMATVLLLTLTIIGTYLFVPTAKVEAQADPAAIAERQTTEAAMRTITVVGEGQVSAAPDTAQASIGVEVIDADVKQATSRAAETMENILATLKAQGIAETDIQTSYYNVWVERPYAFQGGEQADEILYHVNNNVMVTIRNLDKVTTILGAAIEAGANSINSVTFSIADPASLRSQAREKAVANALAEAQELAGFSGIEVGEVVSVSEVISGGAYYVSELKTAEQGGFGGGGGPIAPGDVDLSVQLQITYAIR